MRAVRDPERSRRRCALLPGGDEHGRLLALADDGADGTRARRRCASRRRSPPAPACRRRGRRRRRRNASRTEQRRCRSTAAGARRLCRASGCRCGASAPARRARRAMTSPSGHVGHDLEPPWIDEPQHGIGGRGLDDRRDCAGASPRRRRTGRDDGARRDAVGSRERGLRASASAAWASASSRSASSTSLRAAMPRSNRSLGARLGRRVFCDAAPRRARLRRAAGDVRGRGRNLETDEDVTAADALAFGVRDLGDACRLRRDDHRSAPGAGFTAGRVDHGADVPRSAAPVLDRNDGLLSTSSCLRGRRRSTRSEDEGRGERRVGA